MNFAALGLAPELLRAVKSCGFTQLTPVQEQAIPPARRGRDLLVTAQTGTGKTAAFGISVLQQMLERPRKTIPGALRTLILTPTRELTEQVASNIQAYAQYTSLKIAAIYGGVKVSSQASKIKSGVDILVATPGRLLEHLELNTIDLSHVEFLVLDEADRMLDMGFVGEISKVFGSMTKKPQILFFSATLTSQVNVLAKDVLARPMNITVDKRNAVAATVEHLLYPVDYARKYELFIHLLRSENWFQVMVFSSTREEADKLIKALKDDHIDGAVIHSEKTQGSRRRALQDFKDGKLQVLVATEVAARGLDIQGLDYVVNLDLPFFTEDYVHRVGRTGRAGAKGTAISLVSAADEPKVALIEKVIGTKIKRVKIKGFDVTESMVSTAKPKTQFAKAIATKKPAAAKPSRAKSGLGKSSSAKGAKAVGAKSGTKSQGRAAGKTTKAPTGSRAPKR